MAIAQLQSNMSLHCYMETRQTSVRTLAYASRSIRDFLRHAPVEFLKLALATPDSIGVAIVILTVSGVDNRVGFFAACNSKFYSSNGQGNYRKRALGLISIQKLIDSAVKRNASYQDEERIRQTNNANLSNGGI